MRTWCVVSLLCVMLTAAGVAQVGTNSAVYGRDGVSAVLAKSLSLNMNQTNTDNTVTVGVAKYIVRKVTVTNCSTSFAASLASLAVFSGAAASGSTIVATATLTGLTGATKFTDMTVALSADSLTATTLYLRNIVAFGSTATCDVYVFGDVLP